MSLSEYRENPIELSGELMGKGKDVPPKFEAKIIMSPSAVGLDRDEKRWAEYYQNRETWPSYLIVLKSGEQDLGIVLGMMKGGCKGLIIEAGGLVSHTAIMGREFIQQAMEEQGKHDKVLIGGVEDASSILSDGQEVAVDISDPMHVKIGAK